MRQPLTTSSFHFTYTLILLDGLSIPFFNLGQNVSRTVTLTATSASPHSNFQPDWVLNINRNVSILTESSEVPNGAVQEVASPAASTILNPPTVIVPSQIPDIESVPVVDERNDDVESLKRSISLEAQPAQHR